MRSAGRYPTPEELENIERARYRLSTRIRDFHITASRLLGAEKVAAVSGLSEQFSSDGYISDDVRNPENRVISVNTSAVENTLLAFPSVLTGRVNAFVSDLRVHECRLRRAKANDMLGHVRETMSSLAFQYMNKVRQATTTRENLRSYTGVKLLSKEVSFYQQVYNRNASVIGKLDADLKRRYPILLRSDCKVNTAIADVNARGQSQVRLPWFWAAQDGWDGGTAAQPVLVDNDRLMECKFAFRTGSAISQFKQFIESTG